MRPVTSSSRSGPRPVALARASTGGGEAGQSLVEFSLVLTPLMLVLLGIIQFGFIFNSYVTLTNAAREGTRDGTIYVYDRTKSKTQNDLARNDMIKAAILASMNLLSKSPPQFTTGTTWTSGGNGSTFTNGDLTIVYTVPAGITDSDSRTGQQVTATALYHQDLIIPLVANLLPRDANNRLGLTGQVTMVIN
jgi:Flp pilus assembly protein TadG